MRTITARIFEYDTSKTTLIVKVWLVNDSEGRKAMGFMVKDHLAEKLLKKEYKDNYHEMTVESGWIIGVSD